MQILHSLSALPQLISILQKGAYILLWCPSFCSCCQGTPLHHLALMTSGAYVHGPHKTINKGDRVPKQLPPSGHCKRQQTQELNPPRKRPISCTLRGRLLSKHTSKADCKPFLRAQRMGSIFVLPLHRTPECQRLSEGRS